MTIDDATLFAYLDGILDPADRQRVALAIASDTALAERVARQQELVRAAQASFAGDLEEPIPDRWIAAIDAALPATDAGSVASMAAARDRRAARWSNWQAGGAIAAALVLGLFFGRGIGATDGGIVAASGASVMASAPVAEALDKALSGVPVRLAGSRSLDVQLSLRTAEGSFCREALISDSAHGHRLVACREEGGWRVAGLAREEARGSGFETVGGDGPLDALVQGLGGEPLDAAAEQRAIAARWKR
ncbi:MAG TPA: hypothetical protein VGW34_03930 [Allosphingosinicella sp.]|nr:hypothetical protein [Allosphingosinicella sp.]